tara:strand:- start:2106 stop:2414 length:309 start_codon:yes stop_codon:yes gene_type:complete
MKNILNTQKQNSVVQSLNINGYRNIIVVVLVLCISPIQGNASTSGEKQVPGAILQVPSGAYIEEIIERLDSQQAVIELQTQYIVKLDEKVKILEDKIKKLEN